MSFTVTANMAGREYAIRLDRPRDISIPVRFDGDRLTAFGAPPPARESYAAGGFVGDVNQGGSCNCDVLRLIPHTSGTHTECVGHISSRPIAVHDVLKDSFLPATLVTIAPERAGESAETYDPNPGESDLLLTRKQLERALQGHPTGFLDAVVIRTLPNGRDKIARNYDADQPPFFSREGIGYLADLGVRHLLVDMPSVDRLNDEGKLTNHRVFWGVEKETHSIDATHPSPKTITELVYVPDDVPDGSYFLNLQIAPFMIDAAPSRPVLFEIEATRA